MANQSLSAEGVLAAATAAEGDGGDADGGGGGGGDGWVQLKLLSLGLIICVSLAGNLSLSLLVARERTLRKAPYFFLLDLCLADAARSAACLPLALASVRRGSAWAYGGAGCKAAAFLAVLFCFHAAFMLLCVAVTRYLAVAHHRFYAKRMTAWTCGGVVCAAWTLAAAMAFPPVLDVGTYKFIREEDQCTFEHRYLKTNDTLGFMLMLAAAVLAAHAFYAKLLLFEYRHRKMKPVQPVPAISQNWTFHGPGATGQAAANWIAGFGRGPLPPTLLGVRQQQQQQQQQNPRGGGGGGGQRRRLLAMDEVRSERRLGRMFYALTVLFLLLWAPYVGACFWRVLVASRGVPRRYLSVAVWMSFAQAAVNPLCCLLLNRDLRQALRARLPAYRGAKQHLPQDEAYCIM
ncbi:putative G-protein coupled receptor 173 [Stigmatopora argus]